MRWRKVVVGDDVQEREVARGRSRRGRCQKGWVVVAGWHCCCCGSSSGTGELNSEEDDYEDAWTSSSYSASSSPPPSCLRACRLGVWVPDLHQQPMK